MYVYIRFGSSGKRSRNDTCEWVSSPRTTGNGEIDLMRGRRGGVFLGNYRYYYRMARAQSVLYILKYYAKIFIVTSAAAAAAVRWIPYNITSASYVGGLSTTAGPRETANRTGRSLCLDDARRTGRMPNRNLFVVIIGPLLFVLLNRRLPVLGVARPQHGL